MAVDITNHLIPWVIAKRMQADAWEEGLGAGRDRWMDSREFGDPPVNPYRQEDER